MIGWSDVGVLWPLWALFVVGGVVGVVLSRRALGAWRSQHSAPMVLLASGLGVMTLGVPLSWMSAYLTTEDMLVCTYVSSFTALAGAVLLLASTQVRTG